MSATLDVFLILGRQVQAREIVEKHTHQKHRNTLKEHFSSDSFSENFRPHKLFRQNVGTPNTSYEAGGALSNIG